MIVPDKAQNSWTSESHKRNGSNGTAAKSLEVIISILNDFAKDENQAKFDNKQQDGVRFSVDY